MSACLCVEGDQKLEFCVISRLLRFFFVQNAAAEHSLLSSDPSGTISPRPVAAAAASKAPPRPAAKAAAAGRKALKDALKQQAVAKKSQAASAAQNSGGGGAGAFGAAGSDGGDADNELFARCAFVRGADLAVRTGGVHVVVVECKWQETNSGHARTSSAWHGLLRKGLACVLSTHKTNTTALCVMVLCHAVCLLQPGPAYWLNHGQQQSCSCSGGPAAGQAWPRTQERPPD
jgi:hypothetical protein